MKLRPTPDELVARAIVNDAVDAAAARVGLRLSDIPHVLAGAMKTYTLNHYFVPLRRLGASEDDIRGRIEVQVEKALADGALGEGVREVTTCVLCGMPALYVWPPGEGRCLEHRNVATPAVVEAQARYDAKAASIAEDWARFDRYARERQSLRTHGVRGGVKR